MMSLSRPCDSCLIYLAERKTKNDVTNHFCCKGDSISLTGEIKNTFQNVNNWSKKFDQVSK